MSGASSIAEAYEVGRRLAEAEVHLYLHEDAELLGEFSEAVRTAVALPEGCVLGAIGSVGRTLPWWSNERLLGSCRGGGPGLVPVQEPTGVGLLDGIVLLQRNPWPWRPMPGWHGYDTVRCLESSGAVVHPALACAHKSRGKGPEHQHAHMDTCRRIAAQWRLSCVY